MARIIAAMSGGVDSSVAAWRLVEEGHEVIGLFMAHGAGGSGSPATVPVPGSGAGAPCLPAGRESRPYGAPPSSAPSPAAGRCCSAADAGDARRVAQRLGIPFYAVSLAEEFEALIEGFLDEYDAGRTPSPCVRCNQDLKFGRLLAFADQLGAEAVATGHYARIAPGPDGGPALFRGADRAKDQSYYLFRLSRAQLARARFPLGDMQKTEVRALARRAGLITADKPDSQELCFVPGDDYRAVYEARRPGGMRAGRLVSADGAVLGRHAGYQRFTVGQRRGLGVALGTPAYVTAIDPASGDVTVGPRKAMLAAGLRATGACWGGAAPAPGATFDALVQVRAGGAAVGARITVEPGNAFTARFAQPVAAVAPGQAAVLSDGDRVLGGGWIERAG